MPTTLTKKQQVEFIETIRATPFDHDAIWYDLHQYGGPNVGACALCSLIQKQAPGQKLPRYAGASALETAARILNISKAEAETIESASLDSVNGGIEAWGQVADTLLELWEAE